MKEQYNSKTGNGTKQLDDLGMILALFAQKKIDAQDLLILDCVNQSMGMREMSRILHIPVATVSRRLARVKHLCA